jgi:multidrug efflux pump subunit AcrA (membrane-fusion protein)
MMRKKIFLIFFLSGVIIFFVTGLIFVFRCKIFRGRPLENIGNVTREIYYCAMHPNFTRDLPGSCAICGMTLVKKSNVTSKPKAAAKKIIYYRNPMDPTVTSPVPMKDSMGMDYVPVYEQEAGAQEAGVYISPEKQQLIGVRKEKVTKRPLTHEILTVGKVTYDPDLYVAQEEYLQAIKTAQAVKNSTLTSITEQSNSLVKASEKKLLLLGMSQEEIAALGKSGLAQENLYLPVSSDSVWAYLNIYEYEIGLVKNGQEVAINTNAFPGEAFEGKVVALTPVLNAETRSLRVRVEVKDPEHKLRPEMFINARINVDLGEKLAVPETAVLDTGIRKIVYLAKENDYLEPVEVNLGQKAQGYYEVLSGLQEDDVVVTSGNFLVDSESKLKGILQGAEHKHGQ